MLFGYIYSALHCQSTSVYLVSLYTDIGPQGILDGSHPSIQDVPRVNCVLLIMTLPGHFHFVFRLWPFSSNLKKKKCDTRIHKMTKVTVPVSCRLLKNEELNPIFFNVPSTIIALLGDFWELKARECPRMSCKSLYFNLKLKQWFTHVIC